MTLAGLVHLDTTGQVASQLQHTVVPLLCLVGWLVPGPRGSASSRVAALGYLRVAVNAVGIGLLFLALSFEAALLDRRLPGVRPSTVPVGRLPS